MVKLPRNADVVIKKRAALPRKQTKDVAKPLPRLTIPRSEARERLAERIAKGIAIRNIPIRTQEELDAAGAERDK